MSTILKALKRLEAAREVQAPRPLREEVVAALESAEAGRLRRSRRRRLVAAAGGGVLLAAIALWLALPPLGRALRAALAARPVAAVSPATVRPEARAVPPPTARPSPAAAAPSPSGVASAREAPLGIGETDDNDDAELPATDAGVRSVPQVAVVQRPPPEPAFQDDQPAPAEAAAPTGPPPGSIPPSPKQVPRYAAALAAQASPGAAGSPRAPEATEPGPAGEAAPAAAPAKPAPAAAPPRARAATRVRVTNARDVDVLRTVWHPHPDRRLALLLLPGESAARELREGETAEGWTVLTIEPSGVVLLHDGVQLRAAVGGGER